MIDYQVKQQKNHLKLFNSVVDPNFLAKFESIRSRTMLSTEALYNFWLCCKYVALKGIQGDVVELGVWQGGSLEVAQHSILKWGGSNKVIGIDTFSGHPPPGVDERDAWGNSMLEEFKRREASGEGWAVAQQSIVERNLAMVNSNFELRSEEINKQSTFQGIDKLTILRLDLDWYIPTQVALNKLFEKIQRGGFIIIDDYGHHSGARKAVDEFILAKGLVLNLQHVNYSCVFAQII
jgi:hypothetical protein